MNEHEVPSDSSAPSIEVRNVGKRYWQLEDRAMLMKSIIPFMAPKRTERWAVRDLNLTLEKGETVGVLGRNGAGKTTLLRMLAGVTRPSEGTVTIRGRVAPLISVGVGFHQEMSGRENIFVNGMLLGLSHAEIEERFDEIVAFAELADFIETPVKFYSSGMFMRLGFSVASHVRPDVLLVDEVLAVGDGAFQVKCMRRMKSMQEGGTTVLIVSHSMGAIRVLCPRAILMHRGRLISDGPTEETIARHNELMSSDDLNGEAANSNTAATILSRVVLSGDHHTYRPQRGERLRYQARVRFNRTVDTPQYELQLISPEGSVVYSLHSVVDRDTEVVVAGTEVDIEAEFTCHLGNGTHRAVLRVCDRDYRQDLCSDGTGHTLFIDPVRGTGGVADLDGRLAVDGRELVQPESLLLEATDTATGEDAVT